MTTGSDKITFLLNEYNTAVLANGLAMIEAVQAIVSERVDGCFTEDYKPTPDQARTYFLALMVEVVELMNELNWKPWKEPRPANLSKITDEFADILAFMGVILNYLDALGADPNKLAAAYVRKTNVNIARFNGEVEGYKVK